MQLKMKTTTTMSFDMNTFNVPAQMTADMQASYAAYMRAQGSYAADVQKAIGSIKHGSVDESKLEVHVAMVKDAEAKLAMIDRRSVQVRNALMQI